jgi:hypothetical protein
MNELNDYKFESFEDFEGFLKNLSTEKLKKSWSVLAALFEKQRKIFENLIPKGDTASLLSFPPEKLKEIFSSYEQQMALFKKESEAMVRCARILFDEEITEGKVEGEKLIENIEELNKINIDLLENYHQNLRFAIDPMTVVDEMFEKQKPRSTPSNSGCMVVVILFIISIATFLL